MVYNYSNNKKEAERVVTISTSDAKILASIVINDVRDYIDNHPVEYAAYLATQRKEVKITPKKKKRKSKKALS